MTKFDAERSRFKALEKWTYLNHANSGIIPQYALDAMVSRLTSRNTEGSDAGAYHDTWCDTDDFRNDVAAMINGEASGVVFGQSSTHLLNLFANGITLEPGDTIVTTDSVYPANAFIWLNKAGQGVELRFAKTGPGGAIPPEDILALVDGRTRAVMLCMVENTTGWRHDLKTIGAACRERGIPLLADVTQCIGALTVDVRDMHIDFLTASGYKWLMSEQGFGFAHISGPLLETLSQSVCGWVGAEDRWHLDAKELHLSRDARRFELGGLNFTAMYGMREVVRRYLQLGPDAVQERILSLVDHVYARAKADLKRFRLAGDFPRDNRSGIVMFAVPEGMALTDAHLAEKGIRARVMNGRLIRTGFHYMNTYEDADRLIGALREFEEEAG